MVQELDGLKGGDIRNVMVFVSDSLRWDCTPERVKRMGVTCRTVASGLYTASSFPTIFSGLYPPRHGVTLFSHRMPRDRIGLLNMPGMNTSLRCETTWVHMPPDDSAIHRSSGRPSGAPLEDLEPPFLYIEDDKGGHSPYGEPFVVEMGGKGAGIPEYFMRVAREGSAKMRRMYRVGVEQSTRNFLHRMGELEEKGIVDETLVVFTSDHGELLGEYGGLVGHGRPPCPELVYVPTVFIHPSLEPGDIGGGVLRHVDLLPTLAGVLGKQVPYEVDGRDVLGDEDLPPWGLNFGRELFLPRSRLSRALAYSSNSIWDEGGGYVFHRYGLMRGVPVFLWRIYKDSSAEFLYLRENMKVTHPLARPGKHVRALFTLTNKELTYLEPGLSRREAKRHIKDYLASHGEVEAEREEFDEVTMERLRALGYIE